MTKLVGIIGYPLAHSISPAFQQAAFDYYSMPVRYHTWPAPPESLGNEVCRLREDEYLGANVTIPHKERVCAYLDDIDSWTRSVGAVNTIVKNGGKLVGYNTDVYGFLRALKEFGEFEPRGKSVLLLGAGGAARAAVFGLASEGIASLIIANRTIERAQSLAFEVGGYALHASAVSLTRSAVARAAGRADLIVNCTSMGMSHIGVEEETLLSARFISPRAMVHDLVYAPPETPLLMEAKKAGARTLNGLPMLIFQGAAAFELWTGKKAPIEVMFRAGKEALIS